MGDEADADWAAGLIEAGQELVRGPRVVRLHSWGGKTGVHDYLMSDGSIVTMTPAEARRRR